jgi:hypothetical protein
MLVAAFVSSGAPEPGASDSAGPAAPLGNGLSAGRDLVLESYAEAVKEGYRFFSYGDAMLIR